MASEKIYTTIFGKNYAFPKDIIVYLDEHHDFDEYRKDLLSFFMSNYLDYQHLSTKDKELIYDKFKYYGSLCVQKLIKNNIYDITVDDLLGTLSIEDHHIDSDNKGVSLFFQAEQEAFAEQLRAAKEELESFWAQAQGAYQTRNSKITGTGTGIITNDIVGYGIWAAVESSTIAKQTASANADYQNEIDDIEKSTSAKRQVRLSRYQEEVWIPRLTNSVNAFVLDLFDKYIEILINKGVFDSETLKYVDITRSQNILQNIETADNKIGVIEAAFISCPFNQSVYEQAIAYENAKEVVDCAKIFGADKYVTQSIMKICRDTATRIFTPEDEIVETLGKYIEVLADGSDSASTMQTYIDIHRRAIESKISALADISHNQSDEKKYIQSIILVPLTDLVDMTDHDITKNVLETILHTVFKHESPQRYESIIKQTARTIINFIIEYRSKIIDAQSCYLTAMKEYNKCKIETDNMIHRINEQLQGLGIFSRSKKKELNGRISELQRILATRKKEFDDAKKAYNTLVSS